MNSYDNKEQRTKNKEQRTKNKEQRTKNKEQRTKNKEQRTKNKEIIPLPFTMAICTACMMVMMEVFLASTASARRLQEV